MSLLGAVAYVLMTRIDVAVFVCALQRVTHKPKIIHVKRLNAVLRYMQANPQRIKYNNMSEHTHLRCVGEAAFKKEEAEGRSLRGSVFLRTGSCVAGGSVHIEATAPTASKPSASGGSVHTEAEAS